IGNATANMSKGRSDRQLADGKQHDYIPAINRADEACQQKGEKRKTQRAVRPAHYFRTQIRLDVILVNSSQCWPGFILPRANLGSNPKIIVCRWRAVAPCPPLHLPGGRWRRECLR